MHIDTDIQTHTDIHTNTKRQLRRENPALFPQSLDRFLPREQAFVFNTTGASSMWRQARGTGSRGLVKGIGPCPVVRSLTAVCCVCDAVPSGMLWSAGSAPSLPHFCLLVHSTLLLLSSPSGPPPEPQHVLGRGSRSVSHVFSHVFSLYPCFGTEWNVSASGSPGDLTFCSPPALQPSRLLRKPIHAHV